MILVVDNSVDKLKTPSKIGSEGENAATKYLKDKGYDIIFKNFRSCYGEIDIIAEYSGYIVFAEVKLRGKNPMVSGRESVTPKKRDKITATAQMWLAENKNGLQPRFDVIEINKLSETEYKIEHIENAF